MTKEEFREARRQLGLTQTQLARELGVTLNAVQKWEGGQREIRRFIELAVLYLLSQRTRKKAPRPS